jgi:transitional endoplasmic reticulum ATPase
VVGLTNRRDLIDPAVIRPGRIGRHIEIGEPSRQRRLDIIRSLANDNPELTDSAAEQLADQLQGVSAAGVVRAAQAFVP